MPSVTSPPELGLRGVDVALGYHGLPVVHEANIELRRGRVTALVGPNGSGKTTLLRGLARLHRPDRGHVVLGGGSDALLLGRRDFAHHVSLLAQSRPVPSGICVRDLVGYGRSPHQGRFRRADPGGAAAVERATVITGVCDLQDRCVDELSGGQLQRVWLACCLAQETDVLLLDEPTTYLDLRYQMEILDLIRDLADDHGVAVGVVLHDLDQAAGVADDIVLLDEGRVRAVGSPADVLTRTRLSATYGIEVDVELDPLTGSLRTRPVGRHTPRRPTSASVTH